MFEIESANAPQYTKTGLINLMVKFAGFSEAIPFTASADDDTNHGRELYQRAIDGEFGNIKAFGG